MVKFTSTIVVLQIVGINCFQLINWWFHYDSFGVYLSCNYITAIILDFICLKSFIEDWANTVSVRLCVYLHFNRRKAIGTIFGVYTIYYFEISFFLCVARCLRLLIHTFVIIMSRICIYFTFLSRLGVIRKLFIDYFLLFLLQHLGASIVGRLGSWLGTISVSLQGVLGMVYIGEILLNSVPFHQCAVSAHHIMYFLPPFPSPLIEMSHCSFVF